ncbi:hypothetical protein DWG18_13535 [Lysobacter sp. TY2-98]|nr:hypothetical protein DWG18_13535 [Lysobacter sp. TY2-98]
MARARAGGKLWTIRSGRDDGRFVHRLITIPRAVSNRVVRSIKTRNFKGLRGFYRISAPSTATMLLI